MMVVVPVNADVDEAEHVTKKYRGHRVDRLQRVAGRNLQLQHHDGDDDRQHAIAESFQSSLGHRVRTSPSRTLAGAHHSGTSTRAEWVARVRVSSAHSRSPATRSGTFGT